MSETQGLPTLVFSSLCLLTVTFLGIPLRKFRLRSQACPTQIGSTQSPSFSAPYGTPLCPVESQEARKCSLCTSHRRWNIILTARTSRHELVLKVRRWTTCLLNWTFLFCPGSLCPCNVICEYRLWGVCLDPTSYTGLRGIDHADCTILWATFWNHLYQ